MTKNTSRRDFLVKMAVGSGVAALQPLLASCSPLQTPSSAPNNSLKIDLHTHYLPLEYRNALLKFSGSNPDGFPTPAWDADAHINFMNHLGISTSFVSISSPHINFGDQNAAWILGRSVNQVGAELVQKYPGRFGLLASLPLPDVKDSLDEIRFAGDELHADGFTLPTNTQEVYLGNPALDAVFQELNKRQAVVVLHPNKPAGVPQNVAEELPVPLMEFFFDTTRTVTNLILKGTLKRFPDIKFVIPHAGAFLTILADRLAPALQMMPLVAGGIDVYGSLKGLYYDLAGFCLPTQLPALLQKVDVEHLLYGSDYPYTPETACTILADQLDKTGSLTDAQRRAVYHDNALKLFPRLQSVK